MKLPHPRLHGNRANGMTLPRTSALGPFDLKQEDCAEEHQPSEPSQGTAARCPSGCRFVHMVPELAVSPPELLEARRCPPGVPIPPGGNTHWNISRAFAAVQPRRVSDSPCSASYQFELSPLRLSPKVPRDRGTRSDRRRFFLRLRPACAASRTGPLAPLLANWAANAPVGKGLARCSTQSALARSQGADRPMPENRGPIVDDDERATVASLEQRVALRPPVLPVARLSWRPPVGRDLRCLAAGSQRAMSRQPE